jgi:hypothetical protein
VSRQGGVLAGRGATGLERSPRGPPPPQWDWSDAGVTGRRPNPGSGQRAGKGRGARGVATGNGPAELVIGPPGPQGAVSRLSTPAAVHRVTIPHSGVQGLLLPAPLTRLIQAGLEPELCPQSSVRGRKRTWTWSQLSTMTFSESLSHGKSGATSTLQDGTREGIQALGTKGDVNHRGGCYGFCCNL